MAVMAVLAGCSSGRHTAAPTTTTAQTASPNPDVVPAVITPAYVNAVFRVLNAVYGNATRTLVSAKQVTPSVKADLRAIFNDPLYEQQLAQARQSLQGTIQNVRQNPGDAVTLVLHLVGQSPTCVFVETATTLTQVLVATTPSPASEYYELSRKQPGTDPDHLNSTPWAISFNEDFQTQTELPNRCE
jgi:hypothetical protein